MNVPRPLVLAILAALVLGPSAGAQRSWTDPAGDHEVGYTAGQQDNESTYVWSQGSQTGWYPFVDVLRASIDEPRDDALTFELEVAALKYQGGEPHKVRRVAYNFYFSFHGVERAVTFSWYPDAAANSRAELRTKDGAFYRIDGSFDLELLEKGNGWRAHIPKFLLRDAELIPIRTGDKLEKVRFHAATFLDSTYFPCINRPLPKECWKARDTIQADAVLGDYDVRRSPPGVGHLALTSPAPLRSSNGLATTYMFQISVHNLGSTPDAALIHVGDFPTDWRLSAPTLIELPARAKVAFPVAVTVPFRHLHGNETYVNVTAESQAEPGIVATQTIGVVWTKIPQPAGHHPELYLHSGGYTGWMNTLKEDEEADPKGTISTCCISVNFLPDRASYRFDYYVPLRPALQLGLDFDVARPVEADIAVRFDEETTPQAWATLAVIDKGGNVVAYVGNQTLKGAKVGKGVEHVFPFRIPVGPGADRVPYIEGYNLRLNLTVRYEVSRSPIPNPGGSAPAYPVLVPDSSRIHLPLVEFMEVVDEALLSSLTRFNLTAKTAVFKDVNPGKVAAFGVEVHNNGDADETVEWSLIGSNTEWAAVSPEASRVPSTGSATVVVTVEAPQDAEEGEAAQLLLVGQSRDDPNAQVFVRLVAQVSRAKDVPDETKLADDLRREARKQDASGVPALDAVVLALALVGAALARRRG